MCGPVQGSSWYELIFGLWVVLLLTLDQVERFIVVGFKVVMELWWQWYIAQSH